MALAGGKTNPGSPPLPHRAVSMEITAGLKGAFRGPSLGRLVELVDGEVT